MRLADVLIIKTRKFFRKENPLKRKDELDLLLYAVDLN